MHLFYLMDANTSKVLITLVQMSDFYGKDGWFYRSMNNLEDATGLSQNVIRAALDALYKKGLVNVDTVGISKGKNPNRYKVNTEKFQDYEKYSLDDIISGGVAKIETTKYKTGHFTPSYMRQQQGQQTGQQTGQKVSTNIENIDNITNIENINNLKNINNLTIDKPTIELKEKEIADPILSCPGEEVKNLVNDNLVKDKKLEVSDGPVESTEPTTPNPLPPVRLNDDVYIGSLTSYQVDLVIDYSNALRKPLNPTGNYELYQEARAWASNYNIADLTNCIYNFYQGGMDELTGELTEKVEEIKSSGKKEHMFITEVLGYIICCCSAAAVSR